MSDDAYAIDFATTLTAQADLLLDRTPFSTWGGYGGLTFRGTRNWLKTRHLFPDGTITERPAPVVAAWSDISGKLDGGPDLAGGCAMFDHPANPRHPVNWYGGSGANTNNYLNAAFLFHEPMPLPANQSLSLRYRVILHDGEWDAPRLQAAYDAWARSV